MNYFQNLLSVECTTEQKGKLTYVSWIEAWTRLKIAHPGATYEVHQTADGSFMHGEGFVMCSVTVPDAAGIDAHRVPVTHTMWLPVMDMKNAQIKQPSSTDINKTLMRCLAKCVAMHGLGSYVYLGEDLPVMSAEDAAPKKTPAARPAAPEPAATPPDAVGSLRAWAATPRSARQIADALVRVDAWPEADRGAGRQILDGLTPTP